MQYLKRLGQRSTPPAAAAAAGAAAPPSRAEPVDLSKSPSVGAPRQEIQVATARVRAEDLHEACEVQQAEARTSEEENETANTELQESLAELNDAEKKLAALRLARQEVREEQAAIKQEQLAHRASLQATQSRLRKELAQRQKAMAEQQRHYDEEEEKVCKRFRAELGSLAVKEEAHRNENRGHQGEQQKIEEILAKLIEENAPIAEACGDLRAELAELDAEAQELGYADLRTKGSKKDGEEEHTGMEELFRQAMQLDSEAERWSAVARELAAQLEDLETEEMTEAAAEARLHRLALGRQRLLRQPASSPQAGDGHQAHGSSDSDNERRPVWRSKRVGGRSTSSTLKNSSPDGQGAVSASKASAAAASVNGSDSSRLWWASGRREVGQAMRGAPAWDENIDGQQPLLAALESGIRARQAFLRSHRRPSKEKPGKEAAHDSRGHRTSCSSRQHSEPAGHAAETAPAAWGNRAPPAAVTAKSSMLAAESSAAVHTNRILREEVLKLEASASAQQEAAAKDAAESTKVQQRPTVTMDRLPQAATLGGGSPRHAEAPLQPIDLALQGAEARLRRAFQEQAQDSQQMIAAFQESVTRKSKAKSKKTKSSRRRSSAQENENADQRGPEAERQQQIDEEVLADL